jgi:hypothetical protein
MDPKNLPSFEDLEKEAITSPTIQPQPGTETIDLSGVLTQGLTTSGSFNAIGTKESSFYKLLHALPVPGGGATDQRISAIEGAEVVIPVSVRRSSSRNGISG